MERILLKMAAQLNAFDEASLMSLWGKFAEQVENFEPTKRWEETALALGMIQAVHMKNQLFNHKLAQASKAEKNSLGSSAESDFLAMMGKNKKTEAQTPDKAPDESLKSGPVATSVRCKVLPFKARD